MSVLSEYTDQQLLTLTKGSNERAMTEIFDRYWHKLLAVALNRLNNLEDAEECVQDVFIKLWKLRETLELKYSLYTYLSAAVRYRVLDMLDKQHRAVHFATKTLSDLTDVGSSGTAPDANLLERELIEKIEVAVKQLPEKCQIVYRMSREDGFSHKKIATELSISEKTVEAHLSKAVRDIRSNLSITFPSIIIWFCFNDIYHKL